MTCGVCEGQADRPTTSKALAYQLCQECNADPDLDHLEYWVEEESAENRHGGD